MRLTKNQIILLVIIVIAALLRIVGLTTHSLWWDELQSVRTANPSNSFSDIEQICKQSYDPAPRTFYFLLNVWFKIFGYNDFTARLFTALFGIAAIPVMYFLGKKFQDKNTGLIAALITAISYFHIYYSLEVRFYSLLFFFSAVSYLFFLRSLERNSLFNLVIFAVSTLFLMCLHYFGILILVTQGLAWIYLYRQEIFKNFKVHKKLLLTFLLITIAYLPFIAGLLKTLNTETAALSGNPGSYFFINYFKTFFGYSGIIVIPAAIALLFFIIVSFLSIENKIKPATTLTLCIWMLLPITIAYTRTLFSSPTMGERYFIIVLPAILVAVSLGINSIIVPHLKYAFIILYFSASVISLTGEHRFYSHAAKDDFRGIVKYIRAKEEMSRFYVLSDKNWHFKYYFDQQKLHPLYIDHKNYSDARFYLTKEINTDEKLINDTSISHVWVISAHFSNLEKMRSSINSLLSSRHFYPADSFESKDAFAKLIVRKKPEEEFIRYTVTFPHDQLIDLDNEKVLPVWSGEIVLNAAGLFKGRYKMSILSKGTQASGVYPHINVFINSQKVGDYSATQQFELKTLYFELKEEYAVIKLQMDNDLYDPDKNEDRNEFVRSIIITKERESFPQ